MLFVLLQVTVAFFCISAPIYKEENQNKTCSKSNSFMVRRFVHEVWKPIFQKFNVHMPKECPLHFSRDVYKPQELAKLHYRMNLWTCSFCGKSFINENFINKHMSLKHLDRTLKGEELVCLAEFCDIFRCDAFELSTKEVFTRKEPKSSSSSALVLGPPKDLADLLKENEGMGGGIKNSDIKLGEQNKHSINRNEEVKLSQGSYSWFKQKELKEYECDPSQMKSAFGKCEKLIDECVSPLLGQLSNEDFTTIVEYLNRHQCYYLNCDRYSQFHGTKKPISSLNIILPLGVSLIIFLSITYYIIWYRF